MILAGLGGGEPENNPGFFQVTHGLDDPVEMSRTPAPVGIFLESLRG